MSGTNTRVHEEEELMVINIDSTEQSRARLQLQLTPRCASSASLDLRGRAPPHPTLGFVLRLARPRGHGLRLARRGPIPPPTTPGPNVWAWVKTLTSGKRLARLDITRGHDEPYLRIHIKNSVGRVGAVLLNPHTNADRRVSSPRCPPGRSGAP